MKKVFMSVCLLLVCVLCACGIPNRLLNADDAAKLSDYEETGGPISFISRIAVFDLSAPDHVVVRVKLENGIKKVDCTGRSVESGLMEYKNGKLVIHKDYFDSYKSPTEKKLNIEDDKGNSATIPMIVATKVITTAEEFQAINESAATLRGFYVLGADLDFAGMNYRMLGLITEDKNDALVNPFAGLLEGAGHTISNVTVSRQGGGDSDYIAGLIYHIGDTGVVRNLNLANITVNVTGGIGGGIAGINIGTILNCYVEGTITAGGYNEPSGGIAGFNTGIGEDNGIYNCIANVKMTNGFTICGGNFDKAKVLNCVGIVKAGSAIPELGGFLHAGVEEKPHDVGFEVLNAYVFNLFGATAAGCMNLDGADGLKVPSNFSTFSDSVWDKTAGSNISLRKLYVPNVLA